MDKQMQVVFSASRNLYPYITAGIHSLIQNNPNCKVWLFLEDDEVPYALPEQCEIVNVAGQTFFGEDCANIRTTYTYMSLMRATYAKLFTGEPNGYGIETLPYADKVFQFDVDTYCLENFEPVWKLDMGSRWFAATQEYLSVHKPKPVYWNLGFGLIGLDALRKDGLAEYMITDLRRIKYPWIDQDCLCRLGYHNRDKVWELGVRYNDCSQTGHVQRPALVHLCAEPGNKFLREDVYNYDKIKKWREFYEIEACRKAGIEC